MSVLAAVADFLSFAARAYALGARIEAGRMTPEEQAAAVRALLVETGPKAAPVQPAALGAVAA